MMTPFDKLKSLPQAKKYLKPHVTFEILEAQEDIFDYIEVFYNRQRLHSTNDYWSPVDYEAMQKIV